MSTDSRWIQLLSNNKMHVPIDSFEIFIAPKLLANLSGYLVSSVFSRISSSECSTWINSMPPNSVEYSLDSPVVATIVRIGIFDITAHLERASSNEM